MLFPIKRRWNWNPAELHPQFAAMTPGLSLVLPMWNEGGDEVNLVNGRIFTRVTGTTWTTGPAGVQATRTAGTEDHFRCLGYRAANGGLDWTVLAFANPSGTMSGTNNAGSLFHTWNGGNGAEWGIQINYNASNARENGFFTPTISNGTSSSGAAVSGGVDGKWHTFVGRRSGNTMTAWIDGSQRASVATVSGGIDAFDMNSYIGGFGSGFSGWGINGSIAIIAVWQRALSDQELVTLGANWHGLLERRPSYVSLWAGAAAESGPPPVTTGRQYHYAESLARTTTISTTFGDKTALTFTPDASASYWLLWSATGDGSTITQDANFRLQHDTGSATLCDHNIESADATDVYHVGGLAVYTAPGSPSSQTFSIEYASESGQTVGIANASLVALKADAADAWQETASAAARSSSTFAAAATLNFTPSTAGDYLIIAYAETTASSTTVGTFVRLHDGSTAYGAAEPINSKDPANYIPWLTFVRATGLSGSQSWAIQYRGNGTATTTLRNLRILALRLDAFPAYHYGETRAEQTTTGTTDVDAASVTASTENHPHLILSTALIRNSSTSVSTLASFKKDGSAVGSSVIREANIANGRNFFGTMYVETPTADSHTYKCSFTSETSGNTAGMLESAIVLLQLEKISTGPQGLTGAFLSSTALFYAATLAPGAVGLSAPFVTSTAALQAPSVATTVAPPLLASTATLAQPSIATGAVAVSPPALASAAVLRQPSVAPGSVTINPTAIASSSVLHLPGLTAGAVGLSPPIIVNVAALHQASVAPGAVALAPPAQASTLALYQPVVTPPAQGISAAPLATTLALHAPSVTPGAVALLLSHLASAASIYGPSLHLNLLVPALSATTALHQPDVAQGPVTLQPSFIDSTAALTAPTITTGAVSLIASVIASALVLYAPSLGAGATDLESATIGSIAALHGPSLSLTLDLPIMSSTAVAHAPSLAYALALPTVAAASALYGPSLATALALPFIGSGAGLYPPVLTPGSVLAALPVIASTEALYGASLTSDGALALVQIPSTAALHGPSLLLNLATAHRGSTEVFHGPSLALNLLASSLASTAVLYGPSVFLGAVALQPPHVDSTAAMYAATLGTGAVALTPPGIGSTAATFAPSLAMVLAAAHRPSGETQHPPSLALNLLTDALAPTAEIYAPLVPPPAGGLATAAIESAAALHEPLVTAVTAIVAAYLDGTMATHAPSVARGPVTVLLPHLDATVILRPPMVIQGASGIAHRINVTLTFGAHGLARLEQANRGALQLPSTRRQRVQLRWTNNGT